MDQVEQIKNLIKGIEWVKKHIEKDSCQIQWDFIEFGRLGEEVRSWFEKLERKYEEVRDTIIDPKSDDKLTEWSDEDIREAIWSTDPDRYQALKHELNLVIIRMKKDEQTEIAPKSETALPEDEADTVEDKKTKPRISKNEANLRARKYLQINKSRRISARELHKEIDCSLGLVAKLPVWKAYQEKIKEMNPPKTPKAVPFTKKIEATTGQDDDPLEKLINEQKADQELDNATKPKFIPRRKP
ncbi:hypothetical protein ACFL02_03975 [Planctomycetota bacterium]